MSQARPRFNSVRRPVIFLFAWALGLGLVLLVMNYAGRTPLVRAESAPAPLAPQQADLELNKEGPEEVLVGQVVTYTLRITNSSGATIQEGDAVITDTWLAEIGPTNLGTPAFYNGNFTLDPDTIPSWVIDSDYDSPTSVGSTGWARWDLGELAAGFQGTIEFTMTVPITNQPAYTEDPDDIVGPSTLDNSAEIHHPTLTTDDADHVVSYIYGPVLTLTKSYTTEVGERPGRIMTFTLTLRNLSTQEREDSYPATGIVIWEILPDDLLYQDAWAEAPLVAGSPEYDPASRHITWTLDPAFTLNPGETTLVTFTVRLKPDQDWEQNIYNRAENCWADAEELVNPVQCWVDLKFKTLGIFDKTYITEPETQETTGGYEPLEENKTYPSHLVTYTVYVFNPLSQSVASNLRITDNMPVTWDFEKMVDGPDPAWPTPTGAITRTAVWQWSGTALEPDGVLSFTFAARVGPDTLVDDPSCGNSRYYNDLAASADEFPKIYQYGKSFGGTKNGLAEIYVQEQLILSKDVQPGDQYPGGLVTYTINLHNQGNRAVHNVRVTDVMPINEPFYFRYHSMVDGPTPVFTSSNGPTVTWEIPVVAAQSEYEFSFKAVVEGIWGQKLPHGNNLYGFNDEGLSCDRENKEQVTVLSPIQHLKGADPPLGDPPEDGEWVVQGEFFTYSVLYVNVSPLFDYQIYQFWDDLPIVNKDGDYGGFEVNGNEDYVTDTPNLPFTLTHNVGNSWTHTFNVDTPGYGTGTDWCNVLKIDEDSRISKFENQKIYQFGGRYYPGTFGVYVTSPTLQLQNTDKAAPIFFKPHVDLFQDVYPKTASYGGTVAVTLTLHNNTRNYNGGVEQNVTGIDMTYTIPPDFTFIEMITPTTPAPVQTGDGELAWSDIDLDAGQEKYWHFTLEAPFTKKTSNSEGLAKAIPDNPNICIPASEAQAKVEKGVVIVKQPDPAFVGPYGVVEYTLLLENVTSAPVNDAVVTDTLPSQFEYVSIEQGPEPYLVDEPDIVWSGLDFAPAGEDGDEITIRYKARAPGLFGVYYNQVDGFSATTYFTYEEDLEDYMDEVKVTVAAGVGMYKSVVPEQAVAGQTVTYTLILDNRLTDITNLRITDTLPNGFVFQNMIQGVNPIATTPKLVWAIGGDVMEGEQVELVFAVTIDEDVPTGVYYNQASATAYELDNPTSEVSIPDTDLIAPVTVQALPAVSSKTVAPATAATGDLVTYTITLYNPTAYQQLITVTDILPDGFSYKSVIAPTPLPDSTSPVMWQDLRLSSHQTRTLVFRAEIAADASSGIHYNRLDISTAGLELPPKKNLAPVEVEAKPDIALLKSVQPQAIDAGQAVTYELIIENRWTQDVQDIRITDTLPSGFTFREMFGATPVMTSPYLVWTMDYLESGGQARFNFSAVTDEGMLTADYCNEASGIGYRADSPTTAVVIPSTNLTACVAVEGPPTIQRGKQAQPSQVQAGEKVTYTITIYNATEGQRTVRVTDTLPSEFSYAGVLGTTPQPASTDPLVWANLNMAAKETLQLVFQAEVDLYTRSGTYYNGLDAWTADLELPPPQDLAPVIVSEVPRYDLQISKSDGVVKVDEGDTLRYTITYTNVTQAGVHLTDVLITDTFSPAPPDATPVGVAGDWVSAMTTVYTHFVGDLAPNASGSVVFTLALATSIDQSITLISNTVEAGNDTAALAFEADPGNNRATDLDVLRGADLIVTNVGVSPAQPLAGDTVTFDVTVRNQGDEATVNPLGKSWFGVELYLKGSGYEPAGRPQNVFDHFGGFCADSPGCTEVRPAYLITHPSGLAGNGAETTLQFVVTLQEADDYDLYVQADVSFSDPGLGEPWGHSYGLIQEAIEANNIYPESGVHVVSVGESPTKYLYLPLITKGY